MALLMGVRDSRGVWGHVHWANIILRGFGLTGPPRNIGRSCVTLHGTYRRGCHSHSTPTGRPRTSSCAAGHPPPPSAASPLAAWPGACRDGPSPGRRACIERGPPSRHPWTPGAWHRLQGAKKGCTLYKWAIFHGYLKLPEGTWYKYMMPVQMGECEHN